MLSFNSCRYAALYAGRSSSSSVWRVGRVVERAERFEALRWIAILDIVERFGVITPVDVGSSSSSAPGTNEARSEDAFRGLEDGRMRVDSVMREVSVW